MIALARAKPGSLNYGSSGVGAPLHLLAEMFKHAAGLDIAHIPYRGDAPMLTALLSGDVQIAFMPQGTAVPQVQNGQVRGLAITGVKRSTALTELPTLLEAGVKGMEDGTWYGLFAPAGTPRDIVDHMQREIAEVLKAPEVLERLRASGNEPVGGAPGAVRRAVPGRHRPVRKDHRRRENPEAGLNAMRLKRRCLCALLVLSAAATVLPREAQAQAYPNRPIRLIVPFAAGGAVDVLARLLGGKLSDQVGQPVIVENRPGAGGTLAADAGREVAARRLHHPAEHQWRRHRARALQQPAVRSGQGLRAGDPACRLQPHPGGEPEIRHHLDAGVDRARPRPIRASSTTDRAASATRCT